jgi:hypothetical protein
MAISRQSVDWAASVVSGPDKRQQLFRKASRLEAACALLAAVCAIGGVWGFTADSTVLGGIGAETVGGMAILCFTAMMFIAAGAGIEKRFIALVSVLQGDGKQNHEQE